MPEEGKCKQSHEMATVRLSPVQGWERSQQDTGAEQARGGQFLAGVILATSSMNNNQLLVGFLATRVRVEAWQGPGDSLPALPQFWGRRNKLHRKLTSNKDVCFATCSQLMLCIRCSSVEA